MTSSPLRRAAQRRLIIGACAAHASEAVFRASSRAGWEETGDDVVAARIRESVFTDAWTRGRV